MFKSILRKVWRVGAWHVRWSFPTGQLTACTSAVAGLGRDVYGGFRSMCPDPRSVPWHALGDYRLVLLSLLGVQAVMSCAVFGWTLDHLAAGTNAPALGYVAFVAGTTINFLLCRHLGIAVCAEAHARRLAREAEEAGSVIAFSAAR